MLPSFSRLLSPTTFYTPLPFKTFCTVPHPTSQQSSHHPHTTYQPSLHHHVEDNYSQQLITNPHGPPPPPPTPHHFSPVTFANVRTSPQSFLTFGFIPFATLVLNFKTIARASPKLLNLNQEHPSKNCFFGQTLIKLRL